MNPISNPYKHFHLKNNAIMKLVAISVFILCFCTVYGQNTNENLTQTSSALKLVKVDFGNDNVIQYSYNSSGYLEIENSKDFYRKYNYNEQQQLRSIEVYEDKTKLSSNSEIAQRSKTRTEWIHPSNTAKSYTTTFEYNEMGKLMQSMDYFGIKKYQYNSKNQIQSVSFYYNETMKNYIEFEYDKRGNITKETNYQVFENGEKTLFKEYTNEFDKHPNPYSSFHIHVIPGKFSNPNNITKSTYKVIVINDEFETGSKNATYEYNDAGYPVVKNGSITFYYE